MNEATALERQPATEARIAVEYYTDPLCSWSWSLEPQWRRLRYELGPRLTWRYRMAGMIPDWNSYDDPLNSVSSPAQMAPQWYHVRTATGVPLDERIWHEDPPSSSYPACLAVKAAALQGPEAEEAYLRRLRAAALLQRRNVSLPEVLTAVAEELAQATGRFDAERFRRELPGPAARDAFREDLREVRYRGIGRFPSLVVRGLRSGRAVLMVGYRPYSVLRAALEELEPALPPLRSATDPVEYVRYWGRATAQEVAEALGSPPETAVGALSVEVDAGRLRRAGPFLYEAG
ncbi:MAG: DsbA family protein [Armatimonadota bacterium]